MTGHQLDLFRVGPGRNARFDDVLIVIFVVSLISAIVGAAILIDKWFTAWPLALIAPLVLCGVELLLELTHVTTRMTKSQRKLYAEYRLMSEDSRRKIPRLTVGEIGLMGDDECDHLIDRLRVIRALEETNRAARVKAESWYPRIVEMVDLRGKELRDERNKLGGGE